MSLTWEPKWVRVKVSFAGVEIETCKDIVTNLILCPLCSDINRVCPEGRETNIIEEGMVTFFTVEDLINHIRTHGDDRFKRKISIEKKT